MAAASDSLPVSFWSLGWRSLWRDWRAGELTVLAAALALAVGSMGTVGFFADRVKSALTSQASLLLGADAKWTARLAWIYVGARAGHMVFYYARVGWARSTAFTVSLLAQAALLAVVVMSLF